MWLDLQRWSEEGGAGEVGEGGVVAERVSVAAERVGNGGEAGKLVVLGKGGGVFVDILDCVGKDYGVGQGSSCR